MSELMEFLSVHPWGTATAISIVLTGAFSAITKASIF